jgi:hypothetical protein
MTELISLEKIAQWQKLKTLVLDSVSSPITKRVYNMALDEFMGWFQQAPRQTAPCRGAPNCRNRFSQSGSPRAVRHRCSVLHFQVEAHAEIPSANCFHEVSSSFLPSGSPFWCRRERGTSIRANPAGSHGHCTAISNIWEETAVPNQRKLGYSPTLPRAIHDWHRSECRARANPEGVWRNCDGSVRPGAMNRGSGRSAVADTRSS